MPKVELPKVDLSKVPKISMPEIELEGLVADPLAQLDSFLEVSSELVS